MTGFQIENVSGLPTDNQVQLSNTKAVDGAATANSGVFKSATSVLPVAKTVDASRNALGLQHQTSFLSKFHHAQLYK